MIRNGKRIGVFTLGCKVNQVEGAYLKEALASQGARIVPFKEPASLYVLNTCAVTARAAAEGRKLIRQALVRHPELVLVTGCYAQTAPEEIKTLDPHRVAVLGHQEKFRLPEILKAHSFKDLVGKILVTPSAHLKRAEPAPLTHFPGHTRAFLRVQDGCSARCAYCIVPLARGPSRSLPLEEIRFQAQRFLEAGYQEIVVTGIHLGHWGRDLNPPKTLLHLLEALESLDGFRIRLSSLEVNEVSLGLLSWGEKSAKFCPHFHIPLQSGSARLLKAMGRNYTPQEYLEVLWEIRRRFPQAALGADVMVGFPGETEQDFEATYKLIAQSPLTYLHVFPFSPRPGTQVFKAPRVDPTEVERRAQKLRALGEERKRRFYQAQEGQILEVLVEKSSGDLLQGLSENYLTVYFKGPLFLQGKRVRIKVVKVEGFRVYGERL